MTLAPRRKAESCERRVEGPLDPITECGRIFSAQAGAHVTVIGGPEEQWITQAQKGADAAFGGADFMLTELILKFPDFIDKSTRTERYSRDAVILVRKGNPKKIAEFKNLTQPGIKIVDVTGADQIGLWEDTASLARVADLQKQIALSVTSSAAAVSAWRADPSLDAWITFLTWHYRLPEATETVEIDRKYWPSRATPIAITRPVLTLRLRRNLSLTGRAMEGRRSSRNRVTTNLFSQVKLSLPGVAGAKLHIHSS